MPTLPASCNTRSAHGRGRGSARAALALLATFVATTAASVSRADETIGAEEYRGHCASCHGAEGRGDGPVAEHLSLPPSNLREIARRNDGEFPTTEILRIIDGRRVVDGHGSREMPVWGRRYSAEAGESHGAVRAEAEVRSRILAIVDYLQQIQER